MFCTKCGTQVNESDMFCKVCGNRLNSDSSNPVEAQDTNLNNPAPLTPAKTSISSKKKIIIISAIGVCVLLIALILIISGSRNNDYSDSSYNSGYNSEYGISCHSTYEHKNALYYYDFDDDNVISKYEIQAFMDAHPNVIYDSGFMDWAESIAE